MKAKVCEHCQKLTYRTRLRRSVRLCADPAVPVACHCVSTTARPAGPGWHLTKQERRRAA